jgi:hypothetical protein
MTRNATLIDIAAMQALHETEDLLDLRCGDDSDAQKIVHAIVAAVTPLIEAAVLEKEAKALAPFARAADVYHEERFAPSDEITGRFGKIVRAEELWCLRNLYTRLRARAKHARELP